MCKEMHRNICINVHTYINIYHIRFIKNLFLGLFLIFFFLVQQIWAKRGKTKVIEFNTSSLIVFLCGGAGNCMMKCFYLGHIILKALFLTTLCVSWYS